MSIVTGSLNSSGAWSVRDNARSQVRIVNLVGLYWQIGRDIPERQQQQGWGAGVVDRLARDLKSAFPDMRDSLRVT